MAVSVAVSVSVSVAVTESVTNGLQEVAVVAVVVVHGDGLVVDGLEHGNWVSLHHVDRNFDDVHDGHFHDLLNGDRMVNWDLDQLLNRDAHDLLHGVRDRSVNGHVLDLDNRYGHVPDDRHTDRVGLRYWNLHALGHRHRVRLGHAVGNLAVHVETFFANSVLCGRAIAVSQAMDGVDHWSSWSLKRGCSAIYETTADRSSAVYDRSTTDSSCNNSSGSWS